MANRRFLFSFRMCRRKIKGEPAATSVKGGDVHTRARKRVYDPDTRHRVAGDTSIATTFLCI